MLLIAIVVYAPSVLTAASTAFPTITSQVPDSSCASGISSPVETPLAIQP
jgi:hypothetical protein